MMAEIILLTLLFIIIIVFYEIENSKIKKEYDILVKEAEVLKFLNENPNKYYFYDERVVWGTYKHLMVMIDGEIYDIVIDYNSPEVDKLYKVEEKYIYVFIKDKMVVKKAYCDNEQFNKSFKIAYCNGKYMAIDITYS